ncbi:SAP domain-containing protein [Helcococcus kunzii]|uniref:SAP domain-containing protein n=1 Tax=Helcococcus kunzii TaxID=40091 RepID=UPI00389C0F3F
MFDKLKSLFSIKNKIEKYDGLETSEIILLNWANRRGSIENPPLYFESYGIDIEKSTKKLISKKLLDSNNDLKERLSKLTVDKLKNILGSINEKISGKKQELIDRIIDSGINIDESIAPDVLSATNEGISIINKYDYIIKAHSDRYVDIQNILDAKKSNKEISSFSELKKIALNKIYKEALSENNYGLARNTCLGLYDAYFDNKEYEKALMYIITVIISDLSGLDNNYDYKRGPMVDYINLPEHIYEMFLDTYDLVDKKYFDDIFENAVTLFNKQRYKGFINSRNIKFIHQYINKIDGNSIILNYFKEEYKSYNLKDYYKKIGLDF